ncbi:MAG TPA: prolipoprotein diacylglyceryl transferase family protein, partial [Chthonomonadaceae bacterium]|nr:prolipoprotein diacylglyceryl transferase family protein [Chthonomonadaceae bacterium]
YTSVASVGILAVLLLVARRKPPENTLFCLQGLLFCAVRFAIEFVREGPRLPGGLTAAQWACLAGALFFAVLFHRVTRAANGLASQPAPAAA